MLVRHPRVQPIVRVRAQSKAGLQIANPVDHAAQGGRLYGRRTSAVRVLSVGMAAPALHTGDMASDTRATAFVTGAAGFIGTALVVLG